MLNEDWIISIQNTANEIINNIPGGDGVISFILEEYGATNIDDLDPGNYEDVFSELYAYLENSN